MCGGDTQLEPDYLDPHVYPRAEQPRRRTREGRRPRGGAQDRPGGIAERAPVPRHVSVRETSAARGRHRKQRRRPPGSFRPATQVEQQFAQPKGIRRLVFTGGWRVIRPASVGASFRRSLEAVARRRRFTMVGMATPHRVAPIFHSCRLVSFIASLDSARSLEKTAHMV